LSSNIASFRTWFQGHVSNQNFTDGFLLKFHLFFFGHCSSPPIVCLVYTTMYDLVQFQKCNTSYERLLQWQQNRSKAMMWQLYKYSSYSRVPKTLLLDWQLYVPCYYPPSPTDYPSTTRGMSVGPSVAVNIKFCGYLWFLSISFVWIIWVQYATDNLSGQQPEFASWASVDISTHSEPQSKR
jgi:hypothetical protein